MKKIISLFLCLLLISSVAFALISCGETETPPVDPPTGDETPEDDPEETVSYEDLPSSERALKLDELSTEKMDNISSYTFTTSGEMKFTVMNTEATAVISGKDIRLATDSAFRHHRETQVTVSLADMTMETKETLGFYNGTAYVSDKSGSEGYAFRSALTVDGYIAHSERFVEDSFSDFNAESASKRSSKKNSDGGWTITFFDFSESAIKGLVKSFEGFTDEISPDDVTVKIVLDKNLYYKSFSLDFKFSEDSDFEKLNVSINVTDIEKNNMEFPDIDLTEYTEISDVRVLDMLDEELKKIKGDAEDGEMKQAELTVTQRQVNNGSITAVEETDIISYGMLDGKFTYHINSKIANSVNNRVTTTKYIIDYKNGTKSIEKYNYKDVLQSADTAKSDDETERTFINGLLNQMQYERSLIITMETDSHNPFKFHITANVPEGLISGVSYYSGEMSYKITFDENGNLKEIYGELSLKLNSSSTQTYIIKANCVFGEAETE